MFRKGKHLSLMKFWLSEFLGVPSIFIFHKPPGDSQDEKILGNTDLSDSFESSKETDTKKKVLAFVIYLHVTVLCRTLGNYIYGQFKKQRL